METERRIGLLGATGVGVGAIVGGGILMLAGVAFSVTGPAAIVAFGLNGVIALLTALSFAEMASRFPESGGVYTYSKKVLSVEAAFAVGWVVWFASVVAAVLYAIGFVYFGMVLVVEVWQGLAGAAPEWLSHPILTKGLAVASIAGITLALTRTASGGGQWANIVKVLLFGLLIVGGLVAAGRQPGEATANALRPFFSSGLRGLVQAMGYTFIALQGFDLVAAVGGEVREPAKNLPRAMIASLGIAVAIYLPLLFVVATVGPGEGESISRVAAADPEGVVVLAAQRSLGSVGYWMVIVAAVLSMFSALQANLFAASRIARTMALDRTLPSPLGRLSPRSEAPVFALLVTALLACLILMALPDAAAAGAAASLIFLVTFALAHGIAMLVHRRSVLNPPPFRVPFYPAVPVLGGVACIGLALFQGVVVPSAGGIVVTWLSIGGLLFLALFARRARMTDVSRIARDPELLALRGRTPLVLVPIANPQNAEAMISLASVLVPAGIGRVLLQTVVVAPPDWRPEDQPAPLDRSQQLLRALVQVSSEVGIRVEVMTTVAAEPMEEIARVAELHRCDSVLLGFSEVQGEQQGMHLELLLGQLDTNVVVLRSGRDWHLDEASRVLVPIGGRGGHGHLLAQLIGSLMRAAEREVTFLRVLPQRSSEDEIRRARRDLGEFVDDAGGGKCRIEIVSSDDTIATVAEFAEQSDLMILGLQRLGRRRKIFGDFARDLARRTTCTMIAMSSRG